MFYFYTGNRHKNKFVRINAPISCKCLSWKVSTAWKRGMGYGKVIHEKKKRKIIEKNGQVSEILKTMGT